MSNSAKNAVRPWVVTESDFRRYVGRALRALQRRPQRLIYVRCTSTSPGQYIRLISPVATPTQIRRAAELFAAGLVRRVTLAAASRLRRKRRAKTHVPKKWKLFSDMSKSEKLRWLAVRDDPPGYTHLSLSDQAYLLSLGIKTNETPSKQNSRLSHPKKRVSKPANRKQAENEKNMRITALPDFSDRRRKLLKRTLSRSTVRKLDKAIAQKLSPRRAANSI